MIAAETCWTMTRQPRPCAATMPTMARPGPRKEKVPPCTIGRLLPILEHWNRVVIPEAKNMVEISSASSSWGIFMAPPMMKGISTVAPNMVR